ncbi:MAG: DUF2892 domain-containing protein [Magnetococcales bacterium]|nr:DUF2892 domain-containing protein [Magnetococcales bacterium]
MSAQRMLFLIMASVILTGIWLTGLGVVHWFLFVAPAGLLFAGITGICPGIIVLKKLGFK